MTYQNIGKGSFIAGILIGLGVIINTLAGIPVLGAFLFSFGLLTIIALGIPLYTGKIGFYKEPKDIKTLGLILFNNLAGILACISLYLIANPKATEMMQAAAAAKFTKPWYAMLIYGIFCGMLIHFAVKTKDKPYLTSMAVIIFILTGSEHCVADFPYLIIAPINPINIIKFLMVVIGNSIGAILIERGLPNEQ